MADVKALDMDVVTEKSGHTIVGMAVSVCITPAAPSPLPIPYPLTGSVGEGIADSPLRTKVCGTNSATVGSVAKACHGNEPGTLKEVVSLNTGGPCAPLTGAFTVICEMGAFAITGSMGMANKGITVGMGSNAGDAGGDASGSGAGGASGSGGDPSKASNQSQSGSGGGGSGDGAGAGGGGGGNDDGKAGKNDPSKPDKNARPGEASGADASHQCQGGEPVDLVTGAVVDEATDLEIPGLIPVVFKRTYSSFRHTDVDATLGPGWAHGFEQRIETLEKTCALRDGEGRWIYFDRVRTGESSFNRRERLTLTRTTETTLRVYAHDTRRSAVFESPSADGPAVLRRIEDAYGNAVVFEYKGAKLACLVDTAGRRVNVAWQGKRIASLAVAAGGSGFVVSYEYGRNGCLVAVTNAVGHSENFEYDARRRLVRTKRYLGAEFVYEYDGDTAACLATYGADGLFEAHFQRDPEKRVTVVDGEEPRVAFWNELGLTERLLLPDGSRLDEAAYDEDGRLIAKANGAGEGWRYWYDVRGNCVQAMDPSQRSMRFEYEGDRLARVISADGQVTRYAYDDRGSCISAEYPWGERYSIGYDARGRLAEVTGTSGREVAFEYDDQNNPVVEIDRRGNRTAYRYDGMGRPISMRDSLGRETRVTYDARGRRTTLTLPDGATTTFAYDAAGHLARVVDALGRATRYGYGGLHALGRVMGADGRTWHIEHTREERVKKIINPLGEEYSFERDLAGRVVSEKTFDGRELHYTRDLAGRVERIVYPDGRARTFAYDRSGRMIRDATRDDAVTYQRDARGRVAAAILEGPGSRHETRFERDANGRVVAEIQGDRRIRYETDVEGRRVSRVLPNGATTRYAYDAAGALSGVEHDGFRLDFQRDAVGREASRSTGTGLRIAREYDPIDRLIGQRATFEAHGSAPSVVANRRWSYDRVGRLERIDDDRWGATTYAHDVLDHVVEAQRAGVREKFEYDTTGSIVSELEELDGRRRESKAEIGPGGVLLRDGDRKYAYDARGRRTRKVEVGNSDAPRATHYEWDERDRLRSATLPDGTTVALAYDALGRRIRKETSPPSRAKTRTTEYVWDGSVLAMQLDSADGARAFVHAPGSYAPLLQQERGEIFTYVLDHIGTPRELVAPDGLVAWAGAQSAWGTIVAEHRDPNALRRYGRPVTTPFRHLGEIADEELGVHFTRYRLFDPEVGRWLSPDPLSLGGGSNVFAFNGAPNRAVDPLGLAPTGATSGPAHGGVPDTTYRRDTRDPATIFKDGFQPRGTSTDLKDYALNNTPSVYVGTTSDKSVATGSSFCTTAGKEPYVYTCHPQTGVDVNSALGSSSPYPHEKEIAVPGGVATQDIEGGQKVNNNGTLGPMIPNPNYVPR